MASASATHTLGRPAILVLGAAALVAAYLVLVPLLVLLFSAFRGPPDYLPFESQARWSLENIATLYRNTALLGRMLPDTLTSVIGTVICTSVAAFTLAWL